MLEYLSKLGGKDLMDVKAIIDKEGTITLMSQNKRCWSLLRFGYCSCLFVFRRDYVVVIICLFHHCHRVALSGVHVL